MTVHWFSNEQQLEYVRRVFAVEHHGVIRMTPDQIDKVTSQRVGQNRLEADLDVDNVERMAVYALDGVPMPRPLVWKRELTDDKVAVLDGNHRLRMAFGELGDTDVEADLVVGPEAAAVDISRVANVQHGRSAMTPVYMAQVMRQQHDEGASGEQIARMWGFTTNQVLAQIRRHEQSERLARVLPARKAKVKATTLDLLPQVEDAHLAALGDAFLDAPKGDQVEVVQRLSATPSAQRELEVERLAGVLQGKRDAARRTGARPPKASTALQSGLTTLAKVTDIVSAYFQATPASQPRMLDQAHAVHAQLAHLLAAVVKGAA